MGDAPAAGSEMVHQNHEEEKNSPEFFDCGGSGNADAFFSSLTSRSVRFVAPKSDCMFLLRVSTEPKSLLGTYIRSVVTFIRSAVFSLMCMKMLQGLPSLSSLTGPTVTLALRLFRLRHYGSIEVIGDLVHLLDHFGQRVGQLHAPCLVDERQHILPGVHQDLILRTLDKA